MNIIRRILRPAGFLGRAAAVVLGSMLALTAASPAAFAVNEPPTGGGGTPLENTPVVHTITVGGTPGWQIALLAVGAAIVAAFIAVLLDRVRAARRQQLSTDTR
jgi:hypothetical protein